MYVCTLKGADKIGSIASFTEIFHQPFKCMYIALLHLVGNYHKKGPFVRNVHRYMNQIEMFFNSGL